MPLRRWEVGNKCPVCERQFVIGDVLVNLVLRVNNQNIEVLLVHEECAKLKREYWKAKV